MLFAARQRFILEYAGGDAYRIVPKHAPHMALAPTGGSQGNSIPVVLKTKNTAAKDQLWYFEDPGAVSYTHLTLPTILLV